MTNKGGNRERLRAIARRAMLAKGLCPDFSGAALAELGKIRGASASGGAGTRDLRSLLWCSIDNDDSQDLDQLTVAESETDGSVKVLVAIADVNSTVPKGSALDAHAACNTTSVYTAGGIFPMLPDKLSTDLTSLGFGSDRSAIVVEVLLAPDGAVRKSDFYGATVRNRAKLAYNATAGWLEGSVPAPDGIARVGGLEENLRLQDRIAQTLREARHLNGALQLDTIEARAVFDGDALKDLAQENRNRAKDLIEDLMIAANSAAARYLSSRRFPSLRRVVRVPKDWGRIVELAAERGTRLPGEPDAAALAKFLVAAKAADPIRFPDLSLSVIKLIGAGEYVLETSESPSGGHFGLAVQDYTHSTAPNRRYPDLITQRLLKAALAGAAPPYSNGELAALARHCTEAEDSAKKVERQVAKSAAAMLLESRIGANFDAIATGASDKGTWVRLPQPPIEGKLVEGAQGVKVGDRLRVRLIATDVERGFIDFKKV